MTDAQKQALADAFVRALTSTPFIRIHCNLTAETGETYVCESWMGKDRHRTEVSRDGKRVIFAKFSDGRRAQEYVPKATLRCGAAEASEVVLEYEASESGKSKLIDHALACRFGILNVSWLRPGEYLVQSLGEIVRESSLVTRESISGQPCYAFHASRGPAAAHILHIDTESLDLIRWTRTQTQTLDVKESTMTRQNDLRIEHFQSDEGWCWGLRAEQFGAGDQGDSR